MSVSVVRECVSVAMVCVCVCACVQHIINTFPCMQFLSCGMRNELKSTGLQFSVIHTYIIIINYIVYNRSTYMFLCIFIYTIKL